MKYTVLITLSLILLPFLVFSQDQIAPAKSGQYYGTQVKVKKPIEAEKIPQKVKSDKKKNLQVIGKVTEVCEKKGCWLNVKINDSTSLFIKMKDYAFFVPADIIGKKVLLDGVAYRETVSVEELRHYASDANKSEAEIASITKPEVKYRFTASGIRVLE